MKKIIAVLLCAVLISVAFSFSAFAVNDESETEQTTQQSVAQETELVLEIDVNKRYTDIVENTDGLVTGLEDKKELSENQKTVYIAVLFAALAVSVVVLAVSVKKVPKEEDIDISGQNKTKKSNKE